jgi:hypothetical protein
VLVGGLLGVVATFLINRNKVWHPSLSLSVSVGSWLITHGSQDALLGRAMSPERIERVLAVLKANELVRHVPDPHCLPGNTCLAHWGVSSVHDVKAVVLGVGTVRFKAEVKFDAHVLATRLLASAQGSAATQYALVKGKKKERKVVN